MPRCPTTGKVTRARYTALKLNELSSVDKPAQVGALASIMKRDDSNPPIAPVQKHSPSILATAVAKYIDSDAGAHTFDEVLQANVFDEKIWPMTSALSQSIRSIMADAKLKPADKETKVTDSVDEFLAAVRDISPTAEKKLAELISTSKKDDSMKTVAELIAENPLLKAHIATIEGDRDTAKASLTTEQTAHVETKKALTAATDEVLKVGETEVRKSVVGVAQFEVTKALMDDRDTARVEKRVDTEFAHLPGTTVEKAAVLKSVMALPEAVSKAAIAIFTSAEKMAAGGFAMLGRSDEQIADISKALTDWNGKVAEIAKRDSIPTHEAMRKARNEAPALFEAYQQAADDKANTNS